MNEDQAWIEHGLSTLFATRSSDAMTHSVTSAPAHRRTRSTPAACEHDEAISGRPCDRIDHATKSVEYIAD